MNPTRDKASPDETVAAAHWHRKLSPRFLRFLFAGGIAAVANFGSRIFFSGYFDYAIAIVLAYSVGLVTAFVLNRSLVFTHSRNSLSVQVLWFVAINAGALAITLSVSLLFAHWLLPVLGVTRFAAEIAHAAGIVAPVITSYLGHKHFTFR